MIKLPLAIATSFSSRSPRKIMALVSTVVFTRVAFFDYLSLEERREILQKRLAHLAEQRAYLHNLQQLADAACASVDAQQRVLAFHIGQIGSEQQ